MTRWPRDPRRCAFVHNTSATVAVQNAFCSLFNEATAPVYLAVYEWGNQPDSSGTVQGFVFSKGILGTTPVQGQKIISDDSTAVGQMRIGNVAQNPTIQFTASAEGGTNAWARNFPFFILSPGWSCTAYSTAQQVNLSVCFWYEMLAPEDLPSLGVGQHLAERPSRHQ